MLHGVNPKGIGSVDGREHERVGGLLLPARPLWPAMLPLLSGQRAEQSPFGHRAGILQHCVVPEEDLAHRTPFHPAQTARLCHTPLAVLLRCAAGPRLEQEPGRFSWTTACI
jgi:hypothetical protein